MLALTLQTLLLLLLAYFTGALLACMLRRLFASRQPQLAPATEISRPAVAVGRTGVEVPRPPYVGPTAVPAREAFRRGEPEQIAARAAAPDPRPAELAVEPPPPPNPAKVIAEAAAVAAAAAAVVAARKAATPPAAEPQARTVIPQAAGASGRSVAVADIAVAPVAKAPAPPPSAAADDLKRIRSIDADIASRLERLGVRRYADIAGWTAADVQRISRELGFKGRIAKENWIEQAYILAKGGDTHYALRMVRGERATAEPTADMWTSRPSVRPVVRVETPSVAPPAGPPTPKAAPPAVAPPAAPQPSAFGRPPSGGVTAAPAPAQSTPRVADLAAFARTAESTPPRAVPAPPAAPASSAASVPPAAPRVPSPAAPLPPAAPPPPGARSVPLAPPSVPPPARPAAPPGAPMSGAPPMPPAAAPPALRDRLVRIRGITAEAEKQLNLAGVSRFAQIAAWTKTDVERFERQLAYEGRIQRENWVEQAQILAKGGETAFSRELDRSSEAGTPGQPTPPAAPAVRGQPDLSSLRSVRSEAFRQEGEPHAATGPRVVRSGTPDDLKRIRGVGVLIEKKLNAMGVIRYEQIANWTSADIASVSAALDFKGRIERESWVEQARILQAGGQTEFSRRIDRGEIK